MQTQFKRSSFRFSALLLFMLGLQFCILSQLPAQDVVISGNVDPGAASSPVWNVPGDHLSVGNTGVGSLAIGANGSVTSPNVIVGQALGGSGNVTIQGGSLTAVESLQLGMNGGYGELNLSGTGALTVGSSIVLGASTIPLPSSDDPTGVLRMSGGSLLLEGTVDGQGNRQLGSIVVGMSLFSENPDNPLDPNVTWISGHGLMEVSGGNVQVGHLYVAFSNVGGGSGTLKVSGNGSITTENMDIGMNSSDPFDALLEISGSASVKSDVSDLRKGNSNIVTMSGGSWETGFLTSEATITISGGAVTSGSAVMAGTTKISGGTWDITDDFYLGGALEVSGTGAVSSKNGSVGFREGDANSATVSGGSWTIAEALNISIAGVLAVSGNGIVTAQGGIILGDYAVDSHGTLQLSGGTLETTKVEVADGSGAIVFNGGVLRALRDEGNFLAGFGAGDVQIQSGGAVLDTSGHNVLVAAPLSGVGALTKRGAGILALSGTNSYAGGTVLESGTLQLADANALGATTGSLTLQGGVLDLNGQSLTVGLLAGNAGAILRSGVTGSTVLTVHQNGDAIYAGGIQDGAGVVHLTKEGIGTLTLAGSNSYSGGTTVTAGILAVRNDQVSTFGTLGSGTTTVQGGALIGQGGGTLSFLESATAGSGTFQINSGASLAAGGGFIRFADNSLAGSGTFINNGALLAGASAAVTRFEGNSSAGNATLIAHGGSNGGLGGGMSFVENSTGGTAQVELHGNGALAISLHNPGSVGIGSLSGNGRVILGSNNLAVGGNNLFTTFSGGMEGNGGSLTKEGSGTLTLSGLNTYSGGTTVTAGILAVRNDHASTFGTLGSGTTTVQGGALIGQGSGTLSFFENATAGSGTFQVNSGSSFAAAGGLIRFADTSLAGSGTFINNGALLTGASAAVTRFEGNSSAGNATLIAHGGSNGGLGGGLSFVENSTGGTAQVELHGNGALAISLHNPGSVGIGSLSGDGKVILGSNNLAVGGNNLSTTFAGGMEGVNGSLTKKGSGTLTLAGLNTYSGNTTVTAGTLLVNGSLTASAITVESAATLGGSGLMTNITLEEGAALSPGNSIGTLTADTFTWNGGSTLLFELGAGGASDLLALSGDLVMGLPGSHAFSFVDAGWQIGQTYTLLTYNGTTAFNAADFTFTNGGPFDGAFALNGNAVQFTLNAVPEPSTVAFLGAALLIMIALRCCQRCSKKPKEVFFF